MNIPRHYEYHEQEYVRRIRQLVREVAELKAENAMLQKLNHKLTHPSLDAAAARPTSAKLRKALTRAVLSPGHDLSCSAARGMESDCTCGWVKIKELVGV